MGKVVSSLSCLKLRVVCRSKIDNKKKTKPILSRGVSFTLDLLSIYYYYY